MPYGMEVDIVHYLEIKHIFTSNNHFSNSHKVSAAKKKMSNRNGTNGLTQIVLGWLVLPIVFLSID